MLPTKTQWKKWSLPSKLTAIGTCVGILGLILGGVGLVMGFFTSERPRPPVEATPALQPPTRLHIRIGSLLQHQFDFTIGSTGQESFVVKNLYLGLRGYAECPLRNERSILAAGAISTAYSIELSTEYARYDLPSLASVGDSGIWTYPGSPDYFAVEILYPDYVLFVVSLEAEGDFLTGESFKLSSEEINLIDVAQGNFGGCLDLSSWYNPTMLRQPPARKYLDNVSVLVAQLLTIHLRLNNSFVFRAPRAQLARAVPEIESIIGSRPRNAVFARNLEQVQAVLSRRRTPQ